MRYYIENTTLFIRGSFRAAGTLISGRIRPVSTILIHSISPNHNVKIPENDCEMIAARHGLGRNCLGLSITAPLKNLCVLQYDYITVFILTGILPGASENLSPVTIIAFSSHGLSDEGLVEIIRVATEAKSEALKGFGPGASAASTGTIIAACEGDEGDLDTGRLTETRKRVRSAVLYGIPQALNRIKNGMPPGSPSFFIFSRLKGEHWLGWTSEDCPYYPCHFAGQRCDFCYCPLYPCGDESLGQWVESSNSGNVWNCSRCTLLHEPEVAEYLKHHPEASKNELVHRFNLKKRIH
ncbi:MAG: adenosylcobinamide amidohydrolase [Methanoregula sp.]|nr:MAG: adenosylcobinamide amidohydrolase [Methanoregula sp.]